MPDMERTTAPWVRVTPANHVWDRMYAAPDGIYIREEGIVDKMAAALRRAEEVTKEWRSAHGIEKARYARFVSEECTEALAAYDQTRSENGIPRTSVQDAPHPGKEDADTCT